MTGSDYHEDAELFRDAISLTDIFYRSVLSGEDELVRVEISVREPIVEAVQTRPARTLLLDPFRRDPAVDVVLVAALSRHEAYAEKLRAALSRREPAIRDFYDVDQAVRAGWIDVHDLAMIDLLRRKLAVPGNDPVDVSDEKLRNLRKQVENRLKPVLRDSDFSNFNLDRAFRAACKFAEALL